MRREVVHYHDLTRAQRGCQNPLDVSFEDLTVGRALHGQGRSHPLYAHAR